MENGGVDVEELNLVGSLWTTVQPKMQDLGMPVDFIDEKVKSALNDVLQSPLESFHDSLETLLTLISKCISDSRSLVNDLPGALKNAWKQADDAIDVSDLCEKLPPSLLRLHDEILIAIKDPAALLPRASCFPDQQIDLDGAIDKLVAESGENAKDPASATRDRSGSGTSKRDTIWKSAENSFDSIATPVRQTLPKVLRLRELFESLESALEPLSALARSFEELAEKQSSLMKKTQSLRSRSDPSRDNGESGFAMFQQILTEVNELRKELSGVSGEDGIVSQINRSINDAKSTRGTLEKVADDIRELGLDGLAEKVRNLDAAYETVGKAALDCMDPKGWKACILIPSPYFERMNESINQVKSVADPASAADALQKSLDTALGPFGGLQLLSGADGNGSRSVSSGPSGWAGEKASDLLRNTEAAQECGTRIVTQTRESFESMPEKCLGATRVALDRVADECAQKLQENVAANAVKHASGAIGNLMGEEAGEKVSGMLGSLTGNLGGFFS
eukprot:CAMPEP_0182442550 /NCGR_PEP_ID=MMETSP1172-20130603/1457_1 /TAXON_ID=708627 /ORGANISM="Timspurckia oligopyrenoides, Strain CCMP3278" /LENGTH=507 /DNA_ID=CAMNT_0024637471 /DNA_START=9 /DNA_END=1532 /DNA_ORIENTATION=+